MVPQRIAKRSVRAAVRCSSSTDMGCTYAFNVTVFLKTFLSKYKNILKPEGTIHLKTDSEFLFGYTLGIIANQGEIMYAHHNIYNNSSAPQAAVAIQTFYEQQFLEQGKAITYMQFKP